MTLFSAVLASLGLSQPEAAAFLKVRLDTVKSWGAGRNPVPPGIYAELHALAQRQRSAAEAMLAVRDDAKQVAKGEEPDRIELALPDAAEIVRRGWPSRGAFMAAAARLWALLPPGAELRIVPAGSTEAVQRAERMRLTLN